MSRTRFRMTVVVLAIAMLAAGLVAGSAFADSGGVVPSRVVLLSDHSTPVKTWSPLAVRVRLEAEDGTPLTGRNMRIWDDSYERWRCCGPPQWRTTDSNGEVNAVLYLDGNSANPVRVAAFWYGDAVYDKAIVQWYQPVLGYDTTLTVTHATQRTSGQTLPVTMSVQRTEPTLGCIDGAVVEVELSGPMTLTATGTIHWDAFARTCRADVEFDLTVTPGTYTLTAGTGHDGWDRTDEPRTYTGHVDVRWQHDFEDAAGRGTIFVNRATQEYRVVLADGRDSGIVAAGDDMVWLAVSGSANAYYIDLDHAENGDSATGTFVTTGRFSAHGTLNGAVWELSRLI